jgi:putative ABC transport system permease protein
MLKNYFKIFLKIAAESKLYTFLSLFGISLTIMFVMIFSMTISKITSGTGPEKDLKKIVFCWRVKSVPTKNGKKSSGYSISRCGRWISENYFKKIKNADVISMYDGPETWEFIQNGKYQSKLQTRTDAEYWKLFDYKFLQGRPYTNEEVINKANLAVISRSLGMLLFGTEENLQGKTIHYAAMDLTVIGVIEDPPAVDQNARGDLFFPYTLLKYSQNSEDYLGGYITAFKGKGTDQLNRIKKEVQDVVSRLDIADTTQAVYIPGPNSQLEKMTIGFGDPEEYSAGMSVVKYLLFALAFLLLPAINLMALNFARIHERGEEIAIRKSFGAASRMLRNQFLFENLLMTLAGGAIGIILSYLLVALLGNSLSISFDFFTHVPLTFSFNYIVFAAALVACFIFGLLSGYLPALKLSKMKPALYLKGGEL